MRRAVEDGTVTPLLYEERRPALDVNKAAIDNWFEKYHSGTERRAEGGSQAQIRQARRRVRGGERIRLIAWDIALHFSENFKKLGKTLKGQVACDSKLSAIRYKKYLDETGLVSFPGGDLAAGYPRGPQRGG